MAAFLVFHFSGAGGRHHWLCHVPATQDIYLQIDPSLFLFPLLKEIPLTSKSMELVSARTAQLEAANKELEGFAYLGILAFFWTCQAA